MKSRTWVKWSLIVRRGSDLIVSRIQRLRSLIHAHSDLKEKNPIIKLLSTRNVSNTFSLNYPLNQIPITKQERFIILVSFDIQMLYESLKNTILEYEKRKKETQSEGDRKLFKWKVAALGFCIMVIVLIGVLSQLIQSHEEDPSESHNFTFLPKLLSQSTELQAISSVKNLVNGLGKSSRIVFDGSQKLLQGNSLRSTELIQKIDKKTSILFVFNLIEQVSQSPKRFRFGVLLKRQYDSDIDPISNMISVQDSVDDMSSVYFNLNAAKGLKMNIDQGCRLYTFNETDKSLVLMETVSVLDKEDPTESRKVSFGIHRSNCFGETDALAVSKIKQLTGISLSSVKDTKQLLIDRVQVFYLTLNGQNLE